MKNVLRTIAFGAALTVAATAVPSFAAIVSPAIQDQDHDHAQSEQHPDYSKNHYYKVGNQEGYKDYKNKTQRTQHNHSYRNDTDRQAHDYGYQQGLKGQRGYHQTSDPH